MKAFCTYCSKTKSHDPGEIPAILRYQSDRIQKVSEAALILGLPFFVLSGHYGLVSPQDKIPDYDHLLQPEEVSKLSYLLTRQISEQRIDGFVYFSKPLTSSPNVQPYHDALAAACEVLSFPLYIVELKEEEMGSWRGIMGEADAAKIGMISDRVRGEKAFEAILRLHPNDGMVYFKRGEAYEALGDNALAAADFQRAIALFPMDTWKIRAKGALKRVTS